MPITNRTGQLYNPVLTNIGRGYRPEGFIYEQLCPTVSVAQESFQYNVWGQRDFFTNEVETLTPDRAETREIDLSISQETAVAEDHALKVSVSEREKRNSNVDVRQAKVRLLEDRLLLAREVRLANLLNTIDAGGGLDNSMDATPSNNWSHADATIISDLVTAKELVYDAIGREPNVAVIPYKVANAIAQQADILELLKYTVNGQQLIAGTGSDGSQRILPQQLAGLRIIIPRGRRATNAAGQTDALTDIWGDDVRVLYVNPSADLYNPSVAYCFQARGPKVTTWFESDPDGIEWVRNSQGILVEKVVAPFAGATLLNLLS